jgi:hypothetical protein
MFKARYAFMDEMGGDGGAGGAGGAPGGAGGAPAGSGTGGSIDYSALSANFKQALSSDYQSHPALNDIKDLNGLAKSYISAQQMIGADKIVLPRTDATQEEWNNLYTKLGRPEAPDAYELGQGIEFPAGFPHDDKIDSFVKGLFHEAGLNPNQAATLYEGFTKMQIEEFTNATNAQMQSVQAGLDGLRSEWGGKFDTNVAMARQAIHAFGGEDVKALLNQNGLGDHPLLIKTFANIGASLAEDRAFNERSGDGGFVQSQDQARVEISKLQSDEGFMKAYTNRDHPQHQATKARMDALWGKAYPGPQQ